MERDVDAVLHDDASDHHRYIRFDAIVMRFALANLFRDRLAALERLGAAR
jgi:hypothetical protein